MTVFKNNLVKMELKSIGENVAIARMALSSFLMSCDLSLNELDEIKIALSEAISNSIIHGYNNEDNHLVRVIFEVKDDELFLAVEDDGKGIGDIEKAMEPTYSTQEDHMGLGFVFMQTFMDQVEVSSEVNKGTKVVMQKSLAVLENSSPQAM